MITINSISSGYDTERTSLLQSGKENEEKKVFSGTKELSEKDQKIIRALEKIDADVKAHEAAHQAAAGGLARGKSFGYTVGPDGKRYAVSGEVKIDTSPVPNNPQATIAKMQIVRRAALAPGDTSGQDRAVAAQAAKAAAAAQAELQQNSGNINSQQSDNEQKILTSGNPSAKEKNIMQKQLSNVYQQNTINSTVSYSELCSNCNTLSSCNHLSAGIGVYSGISL
jgi:hypothetical protein